MTARRKACRHAAVLEYQLAGSTVHGPFFIHWCRECGALRNIRGDWLLPGAGYEASLRRALRRKQRKEKA